MESTVINDTDILRRYSTIRNQTEFLCEPLSLEDYVVQPIVDVSPPKWHLAHTTWFFETFLLKNYLDDYKEFNREYNYLFNSYYESVGSRMVRTDRGNITRPGVQEINDYRSYVDEKMAVLIDRYSGNPEVLRILEIGLQHEQQHQELLVTDIKYILGHNPTFPVYRKPATEINNHAGVNTEAFLEMPEGVYSIGHRGTGFCFDNEKETHRVYLEPFGIREYLVTNQEYQHFVDDGGYRHFEYWLMEGWEWVKTLETKAPMYWHYLNDQWMQYSLYGLRPLNPQAPVSHISFYEADAFARWKGLRLPTEFEWEVACVQHQPMAPGNSGFSEDGVYAPLPPASAGNPQFLGEVWEWTASAYRPYPRYQPENGALGEYNGKFMVNQMVLRGGSCATPRSHIRPTYRNFFHPHLRWQFTGIRLSKDLS